MAKKLRGVFIADVHFDALPYKIMKKSLNFFLEYVEESKLDIVVIGGDLFDTKIMMTSASAQLVLDFINKLASICEAKGVALRIVRGTLSHDYNQLESLLYLYDNENLDVKIMDKMDEEKFRGYKILYIPEEYIKDADEYYADVINGEYDAVFGHGSWDFCNFSKKGQESEIQVKKAPILDSKKFMGCCRGPILFGHYHIYTNYQNKIFYSGSYERWCQGEENPKGFLKFIVSEDNYKVKFIENENAQVYMTMDLNDSVTGFKINLLQKSIKKFIEENRVDKLRVKVQIDELCTEDTVQILKEHFRENKSISFQVSGNEIDKKLKGKEAKDIEEEQKFKKYHEIINAETVEDSVYLFLQMQGINMSKDTITELLSNNVEKSE